jgi:beta-N-acetylhexosaminidase
MPTSTTGEPTADLPEATEVAPVVTSRPTPSPTPAPSATLTVSPTATPTATPQPDPVAAHVEALLARMSVEEKVGQLFLVFFEGSDLSPALSEMIMKLHIGGIVLFARSGNIESPEQLARLIGDAQALAAREGAGVPLFVAIDQEGGPVSRLTDGFTVFPSNMAVGATGSADRAREMARIMAAEMRAVGINMNLAPVMDVNDNPDNPVIGIRSFGASPELVAQMGAAMIETYQANGILATAKHFPGHGNTAVDSHVGLPVVTGKIERLAAVELAPFRAAIAAGVGAIMTAHVVAPAIEPTAGLPATLSARVLGGLLREQLGYDGLIVTDSLGMGALGRYEAAEVATLAFVAGADVLAFGADPGHGPDEQRAAYEHLLKQVQQGAVTQERLDESVRRILLAKARLGLLKQPAAVQHAVSGPVQGAMALAIARNSITLVRDECGSLPIRPEQQVLVIWPRTAGELGAALQAQHAGAQALPVGIDPTAEEIRTAAQRASENDVVVVGTVNARRHLGQVQLVQALSGSLDRCRLVVAALETPYDLLAFPDAPAYLATYGSVPTSTQALAEALTGASPIRGRLPVELPGIYPLGHGLERPG